jgi:excisionase family DNA binding protein
MDGFQSYAPGRSVVIDLSEEMAQALASPRVRAALADVVREAIRDELAPPRAARDDQLVGVEEAARVLGMTIAAVRKAAARDTLPSHRLGRRVRFKVSELLSLATR